MRDIKEGAWRGSLENSMVKGDNNGLTESDCESGEGVV